MNTRIQTALRAAMVMVVLAATAVPARAAFEDIEVSPRVRAMGTTFSALRWDPYAALHNPASLAWVTQVEGAASYVRPFGYDFSSQSVISGVGQLPGAWGGVGIAFRRFGVDYESENLTGETTVSLAHGFQVLDDLQSTLSLGWSLNIYSLDFGPSVTGIDPGNATSIGINVAAQAVLAERTSVGLYALNFNNPSIGANDEEELRRRVGVGVSYAPYRGVETVLDISHELGEEVQFRGGTEFQITDFLWLRSGLKTEPNIFTAGLGLQHRGIRVDYGFSTGGGVLDPTHQVGIGYMLPAGQ